MFSWRILKSNCFGGGGVDALEGGGEGLRLLGGEVLVVVRGSLGLGVGAGGGGLGLGLGGGGVLQLGQIQLGIFFLSLADLSWEHLRCIQFKHLVQRKEVCLSETFFLQGGQIQLGPGFCSIPALIRSSLSSPAGRVFSFVKINKKSHYHFYSGRMFHHPCQSPQKKTRRWWVACEGVGKWCSWLLPAVADGVRT